MEKDPDRARQIADEIGSIVIAHDGCEGKYLGEAGANRADAVAAVTGDDEDNLVICQMAKHHFDVPRTIARVNNPKNEALFRHLGVDELISPTRMILGSIEQDIPVHELLHLAALGEGELEPSRRTSSRGRPPSAAHRASWTSRTVLAVRGHPRRHRLAAPPRHGVARGRQGDRDRQAGVRGPPPRATHRRSRGGAGRVERRRAGGGGRRPRRDRVLAEDGDAVGADPVQDRRSVGLQRLPILHAT